MKSLALKISLLTALPLLTTSAFAAQMNYIVQAQLGAGATHVPTLSGTMLVLLSLVLFAVAFKYAKQKTGANKLFITLIGVTALSIGGGGFKLVSDASAVLFSPKPLDATGIVPLKEGLNFFSNEMSGKTIKITSFDFVLAEQGTLSCGPDLLHGQECTVNLILEDPDNLTADGKNKCALSCSLPESDGGGSIIIQ